MPEKGGTEGGKARRKRGKGRREGRGPGVGIGELRNMLRETLSWRGVVGLGKRVPTPPAGVEEGGMQGGKEGGRKKKREGGRKEKTCGKEIFTLVVFLQVNFFYFPFLFSWINIIFCLSHCQQDFESLSHSLFPSLL